MIINNNKDEDNSEGVTKALEFGACFVTIGRLSCMTLYVCVCGWVFEDARLCGQFTSTMSLDRNI